MTTKTKWTTAGSLTLLLAVGAAGLRGQEHEGRQPSVAERLTGAVRELQGLVISPVPLNYQGKDIAQLGLGSYFVNGAGGCVGCHTSPTYANGGDPYRGQPEQINTKNFLAGGAVFGPFTSRNITPDAKSGKPADLTYEEFLKVMRTGEDIHRKHPLMGPILQVMPWTEYRKMTDKDLQAIYAYLSAIPHAEPAPPAAP
jgi:mono/diheme cytochrome c family protein